MDDVIGFIGLGQMGGGMARRLQAQGFALCVHDMTSEAMDGVVAAGARRCGSAREVADQASIVLACLPHDAACKAVMVGENGLAGGRAIRTYVELSTVGPDNLASSMERLQRHRIELVDAPVSGGMKGAHAGSLTAIVAGDPRVVARIRPVLDAFSKEVIVVGDRPGLAQACKLVNNALTISAMVATGEAIAAGVKHGLDMATLLRVVNASSGANSSTLDKYPRCMQPPGGEMGALLSQGLKDMDLYVEFCRRAGLPASFGSCVKALMSEAATRYGGDADGSNVFRMFA